KMSCNFLPQRIVDMNKNSDTLSEVSESGTTTSGWNSNWDSREELRDFVTKLGLKDVSDLYQDRFRVDRKKLEQMLTGDNDALIPADVFFAKIMEDTDTYITWPNKLKIGAKSKKDPHVRIAGRPEDVQAAKERIMTILDTKCNRVTMKMDVSYTDHSHIIGKGGLSIKRVMEETQCHVHFPDSNRSNPTEKSNQVSISGDIEGVECARSRVRELIPLIFGFELPIMSQNVDASCPYVGKIQEQYKVQVMFKTRPKLHATLVLVKGVEWENQIPVQMSMEISPHHHQIVLGKNHSNLKSIMQYTSCQIMFPDAQDPNIPNLKKSNVNITGNIHNVYKARQLLIGSLPLIIIFDLPEDSNILRIRPDQIGEIQTTCDLTISIRQKAKQNTKACVIKGIEKYAGRYYRKDEFLTSTRQETLSSDLMNHHYVLISLLLTTCLLSRHSRHFLQVISFQHQPTVIPPPMSPLLSPLISPTWQYPTTNNSGPNAPPFVGMVQQPQFLYNVMQQSMGSSGYQSLSQISQLSASSLSLEQSRGGDSTVSTISTNGSSPLASPRNSLSPNYYRNFSESPSDQMELSSVLSEMSLSCGYHGPSVDKKQDRVNLVPFELENKRLSGLRAMQSRPMPGSYRVPNNSWSGYGISHTSPASYIDKNRSKKDEDIWKMPTSKHNDMYNLPSTSSAATLNTSNILDHTPVHILNRVTSSNWSDLPTMLTSLGLERYMSVFTTHEIDLTTFSTLTDQDLIEIGINAFGARRKILLAISELNKRSSPFSAAPGAERKSSSSTNSTLSPRENW
ncbi:hypothetical protein NQ314_013750, partial [Rhamnusium bicolor]